MNVNSGAEDEGVGPDGKKPKAGISSEIITELSDCNISLSQQRKKRTVLGYSLIYVICDVFGARNRLLTYIYRFSHFFHQLIFVFLFTLLSMSS